MNATIISFVLRAMSTLDPNTDHVELADAITSVVDDREPLFRGDTDKLRTASYLIAVAWRESNFQLDAIGDHGKARCAFQLWAAPKEVLTDPTLCTSIAFDRLAESMRICGPKNPIGIYASGRKGCRSEKAKRISADRLRLADRIWRDARGGQS